MKLPRQFAWIFTTAGLFLGVVTLLASTILANYKSSDVSGVWLGYSEDHLIFLRLEFDDDNSGYLSVKYLPTSAPELYRIENWKLNGGIVEIQTLPIDREAEKVSFTKISILGSWMDGKLSGKEWERHITLVSERAWQSWATEVRERIARYRKDKS